MSDERQNAYRAQLRKETLAYLNRISGNMLDEPLLFAGVNLHIYPRALLVEFRDQLTELEAMGLIVIVRGGPLDSNRKIRITAAGRAALAETHCEQ